MQWRTSSYVSIHFCTIGSKVGVEENIDSLEDHNIMFCDTVLILLNSSDFELIVYMQRFVPLSGTFYLVFKPVSARWRCCNLS